MLADWLGDELLEQLHAPSPATRATCRPSAACARRYRNWSPTSASVAAPAGSKPPTWNSWPCCASARNDSTRFPSKNSKPRCAACSTAKRGWSWKQRLEQDNPELLFSQDEARARVASLAEADVQMRALNRELLGKGIDAARLGSRKQWEDVTRLTGKRSRRLREFIELGAELGLMSLRPVWLMNPDLASRVLPLKAGLFDMVIYDEASQMPVEFALPTLYRGRVTVVSGDEKQMPPTAFFSSRVEATEAELFDGEAPDEDADEEQREAYEDTWNRREIKDCPDLLQLARNALPSTTLQIHYRSAYRELIGFSNASFYGNRLSVPVPPSAGQHPAHQAAGTESR